MRPKDTLIGTNIAVRSRACKRNQKRGTPLVAELYVGSVDRPGRREAACCGVVITKSTAWNAAYGTA